jgi:hypothetical protein
MKPILLKCILLLLFVSLPLEATPSVSNPIISAYFSPTGGCTEAIVEV